MCGDWAPDQFPDQIISEILTCLPAKSVCRFKCVSKTWFSLISSSHFIASFLSHSSPKWAIVNRAIRVVPGLDGGHGLNLSLAEPLSFSSFSIGPPVVDPSDHLTILINGRDGLLLFSVGRNRGPFKEFERGTISFSENNLFVCNPFTRQWVQLPKPPNILDFRGVVGLATRAGGSTGLVLNFVVAEYQPIIGSESASLMTFSSETGKWDVKSANYLLGMRIWRSEGSFEFDGHMYWIDVSFGMVAWDEPFSSEKRVQCRFIPLPHGCMRPYYTPGLEMERCIGTNGGHIQYLEVVEDGGFLRLWSFKDHKEKGEWSLVHKVSLMDIWNDESYLACGLSKVVPYTMFFHPFEADVAIFMVGYNVFCLNVRKKMVVGSCTRSNFVRRDIFVMPFVLPSWPTSLTPAIIAMSEKDRGNEYVREKKFNEAVSWYSRSIISSPTAVAYANRAAGYLNIGQYQEAESDCTETLKLDEKYMKAYARRAIARKELGKLKEAKEDAELALKLEPQQPEVLKLYAEIKSMLEKVTCIAEGDGFEDRVVSQP